MESFMAMTNRGRSSGYGVIFSFDPSSSTYTKLKDFDGTNGAHPMAALFRQAMESYMAWRVEEVQPTLVVIFSFDPSSSTYKAEGF
jgi:hypothetical protein